MLYHSSHLRPSLPFHALVALLFVGFIASTIEGFVTPNNNPSRSRTNSLAIATDGGRGSNAGERPMRQSSGRVTATARFLSQQPVVTDGALDDAFFVKASQRAANERMEQLRRGEDPLAISLSSASPSSSSSEEEETETEMMSREGEGESQKSASRPAEVKIPVDPRRHTQQKREMTDRSRNSYAFQRELLKSRLRMERKEIKEDEKSPIIAAAAAAAAADNAISDKERDVDTISEAPPPASVITEETEEKREAGVEEAGYEYEAEAADKSNPDLLQQAESVAPAKPGLSSDGKVLFEPSPESMNINQENVAQGLLVLTRSFLALSSILEKKGE